MKIGIITFQNAHNYGAQLQVFALKKYLNSLGHEVNVINYINREIEKSYLKNPKNNIKVGGFRSGKKWLIKQVNLLYGLNSYNTKWNRFNDFIINNITNEEKKYSKKEIDFSQYDYVICGSDQIWNPTLTNGFDDVYFANFKSNALKISYAASIGKSSFNDEEEKTFKELLKNFDIISVRENKLEEYIKKITTYEAQTVVDPTLLLESDDYAIFLKDVPYKNYILQYTLIDDPKLDAIVEKIASTYNFKIVELRYEKKLFRRNRIQVADAGVYEFLSLIKNAEIVITNSFHGTIFSILFKKLFYTVKIAGVNSRIENLLNICGLNDRCISSETEFDINQIINYDKVLDNLKLESRKSKDFLNSALSERMKR